MASPAGIPHSKISPKFLHSNSTSHVWAFSAIAELIDNAYDPDVNATNLWIDKQEINEKTCLIFQDNGNGMDNNHLYRMLSFGFCEKDQFRNLSHLPIGHYGNGFKSGSMRLGKDALVFTRHNKTAGIGFLSQTYLDAINAESVVVPLLEYSLPDLTRQDDFKSRSCLKAILDHSVFTKEEDLIQELKDLKKEKTGTKIIIFNLNRLQDQKYELDFYTDEQDIKCREVHMKDDEFTEVKKVRKNSSKYKKSLREYCRILFLHPKMKITLRGKLVRSKIITKCLSMTEKDTYRPLWLKKTIQITFGYRCEDHDSEDYGMVLYHNNRLIRAFEKVGYQKQPNGAGVGIIGVAEVDFLQPTHNKQDFKVDEKYNTVMKAFADKLNDYWNEKEPLIINDENFDKKVQPDSLWACCDDCGKWRRLPKGTEKNSLPEEWFCFMNEDGKHNRCEHPEEQEDKDEFPRSSYIKVNKKKKKEKKNVEKKIIQHVLKQVSQDGSSDLESFINTLTTKAIPEKVDRISSLRKRSAGTVNQDERDAGTNFDTMQPPAKKTSSEPIKKSDLKLNVAESLFKKRVNCVKKEMTHSSTSNILKDSLVRSAVEQAINENKSLSTDNSTSFPDIVVTNLTSEKTKNHDKSNGEVIMALNPANESTNDPFVKLSNEDSICRFQPVTTAKEEGLISSTSHLQLYPTHGAKKCELKFKECDTQTDMEDDSAQLEGLQQNISDLSEKINELTTKLQVRDEINRRTNEKLDRFKHNVHHLIELLVPKQVAGDIGGIEQKVADMIKLKERENRTSEAANDIKPNVSSLPGHSKDKDSQCCIT